MTAVSAEARDVTLLELVDRLLDKGVVLVGDITISVADVDLIVLGLRLLLASAERVQQSGMGPELGSYDALSRLDGDGERTAREQDVPSAASRVVRPVVDLLNHQTASVAEEEANRVLAPARQAMAQFADQLVDVARRALREQVDQLLEPVTAQVVQCAEQALLPLESELERLAGQVISQVVAQAVSQALVSAVASGGETRMALLEARDG